MAVLFATHAIILTLPHFTISFQRYSLSSVFSFLIFFFPPPPANLTHPPTHPTHPTRPTHPTQTNNAINESSVKYRNIYILLRINLAYATCGSVSNSTAPPTCRAKTIRDCVVARRLSIIIDRKKILYFPVLFPRRAIANRFLIGTPRCVNSYFLFSLFFFFFPPPFFSLFSLVRSFIRSFVWLSAYRTASCEPDTVSWWLLPPVDSGRPAKRNTGCSDRGRSTCSSR